MVEEQKTDTGTTEEVHNQGDINGLENASSAENTLDNPDATYNQDAESAQSAAEQNTPEKKKMKPALIIGIIAVVVIIGVVIGFFVHSENEKKAAAEAAEAARIAKIETYNSYIDNLTSVRYLMLSGCATSETAGNLMLDVWRSAIFDSNVDDWSEEAKPYYSTDFNEALSLLFASDVYKEYVKSIKDNEASVDKTMKELRNPPSDCERAYDALQDFYSTYKSFTKLVTNPNGSYQTTSQNFQNLDSEALTQFEKLETLIPDKKDVN